MVRLVFRPYTQLRRSICTSESLRTSTRVSSGFILARHSSPSFGSQHVCSRYSPPAMGHASPEPAPRRDRPSACVELAFTLIAPLGLVRPMTRTHVGLLGPCFKTGRVDHRPTRRRRAPLPQRRDATRAGTGMGPSQGQPGHRGVPVHGGTVPPTRAFDSPATGRGDLLRGKYARGSPRDGGRALRSPTPRLRTLSELNPPVRPSRFHPFSSQRFHALLNSLFKVLFNFPSRYLFAIGLVVIFSLRWSLPPALGCSFKQPDSTEGPFQGPGGKAYGPRTLHG